jgi:hypothetical protein
MKEELIQLERVRATQGLCGFLLDEVINRVGEFYADCRVNVGQLDENKDNDDEV